MYPPIYLLWGASSYPAAGFVVHPVDFPVAHLSLPSVQLQKTVPHLWGIGAISAPVPSESTVL